MMFAWSDREEKVGIALVCSNPRSIDSYSDGGTSDEAHRRIIFDHVHKRLASFHLRNGLLRLVLFHGEFHVVRPARSKARGSGCRVLCERRCCKQEKYEKSFHGASR